MTTATRAGLATGLVLLVALALLLWRALGPAAPDPLDPDAQSPEPSPALVMLDALDRSSAACIAPEQVMQIVTRHALPWSETPPLDCTDAPEGTTWLAVNAEGRVRHFAFGPDGCRIVVSAAACP